MWQTKSTNCVTVDGRGQTPHSAAARGALSAFHTEPGAHFVEGEAGAAYGGALERFTRGILFLEPDLIVIHDRLRAPVAAHFDWRLHAPTPFEPDADGFTVQSGAAACRVTVLEPAALRWEQTDRFDTPPRERVQLVEHHLTAHTGEAAREARFLTILRPYRADAAPPGAASLERSAAGLELRAPLAGGTATVTVTASGELVARVQDASGTEVLSRSFGAARLATK
jgi:hypothetical protein